MDIPEEFYTLLPSFMSKYCVKLKKFDQQRLYDPTPERRDGFMYFENKRPPLDSDWLSHFYLSPRRVRNYILGSLSLSGIGENGLVKVVSIDIDNEEQMYVWNTKLRQSLDALGYDYFIEFGGDETGPEEFDRCHVLLFYDSLPLEDVSNHIRQVFYEINEPVFPNESHIFNRKEILFDEVFPINKPKNKVRPPGGPHLKRGNRRYPCKFKDDLFTDPVEILRAISKIKVITAEDLAKYKNSEIIEKLLSCKPKFNRANEKGITKRPFYSKLLNLELPFENIPEKLKPVVRNCPCINNLLESVKSGLIDHAGHTYHVAQLFLRGITKYVDSMYNTSEGADFYNFLRDNYRFRPDESHQLERKDREDSPFRYFASCEKWNDAFNMCDGCPFLNRIGNPCRFVKAQGIKVVKTGRVKLTTMDTVRNDDFPKLKQDLLRDISLLSEKFTIFGHFTGAGKSVNLLRGSIPDILKANKRVLIAVNSIELAREYKDGLKAVGIDSFLLASHKGSFDPEKKKTRFAKFDCPFYTEIQRLASLGISSRTYKDSYCNGCVCFPECPYPRQYTDVHDSDHKVVIMQHAHFSCEEVLYDLLDKNFDVLFIDETFIDSLYQFIPVKDEEIDLLEKSGFPWAVEIADWIKDEYKIPNRIISPAELELSLLFTAFEKNMQRWLVPDLIRFYNQKRLSKNRGIEVIYELPNIPFKAGTDATVPIELVKHLTGISNIDIKGADLVLDPKSVHPDNEITQILDFTASVSWLQDDNTFNIILEKIASIVYGMDENSQIVITAYLKDHRRIGKFLLDNHPTLYPKIHLAAIQKGVNRFSNYDAQFIMANILFMPDDYVNQAYKYITIANYHRMKKDLTPIPIPSSNDIVTVYENIVRVEKDFTVEYPQFQVRKPAKVDDVNNPSYWHRLIYEYTIGNIQQTIRVRLTPDKPRKIYILNNVPLPGVQITNSITLDDWLSN